jgi:hypothetical protein
LLGTLKTFGDNLEANIKLQMRALLEENKAASMPLVESELTPPGRDLDLGYSDMSDQPRALQAAFEVHQGRHAAQARKQERRRLRVGVEKQTLAARTAHVRFAEQPRHTEDSQGVLALKQQYQREMQRLQRQELHQTRQRRGQRKQQQRDAERRSALPQWDQEIDIGRSIFKPMSVSDTLSPLIYVLEREGKLQSEVSLMRMKSVMNSSVGQALHHTLARTPMCDFPGMKPKEFEKLQPIFTTTALGTQSNVLTTIKDLFKITDKTAWRSDLSKKVHKLKHDAFAQGKTIKPNTKQWTMYQHALLFSHRAYGLQRSLLFRQIVQTAKERRYEACTDLLALWDIGTGQGLLNDALYLFAFGENTVDDKLAIESTTSLLAMFGGGKVNTVDSDTIKAEKEIQMTHTFRQTKAMTSFGLGTFHGNDLDLN